MNIGRGFARIGADEDVRGDVVALNEAAPIRANPRKSVAGRKR